MKYYWTGLAFSHSQKNPRNDWLCLGSVVTLYQPLLWWKIDSSARRFHNIIVLSSCWLMSSFFLKGQYWQTDTAAQRRCLRPPANPQSLQAVIELNAACPHTPRRLLRTARGNCGERCFENRAVWAVPDHWALFCRDRSLCWWRQMGPGWTPHPPAEETDWLARSQGGGIWKLPRTLNGQEIYRMSRRALGLKLCPLIPKELRGDQREQGDHHKGWLVSVQHSRTDASGPNEGRFSMTRWEKKACVCQVVKSNPG